MKFSRHVLTAATLVAGSVLFGNVANAADCSVNDLKFSSTYQEDPASAAAASACSNALDGTGNTPDLSALETLWGAGFIEGATIGDAADGSATGSTVLGGFRFTLSSITATTGGTFELSIEDANGADAPNLPVYLDFVLYLKGGAADTAAYLFEDTLVDELGGGTWAITFLNGGGNTPDLSNISIWVREGSDPGDDDTDLPEPGSLALVGLGLLGLGLSRRRKS